MSAAARRDDLLRKAQAKCAMLRRCGYPDAQVAPEYCIAGEIGPDRFYTETISIYVGEYQPKAVPLTISKAFESAIERLKGKS